MSICDTHGRPWLKLSQIKSGQLVALDTGFTCTKAGKVTIHEDNIGFYFECDDGHHYINGQADDGEHCIGMYP